MKWEGEKGEDADLFKDIILEDDSLHSVPSSDKYYRYACT